MNQRQNDPLEPTREQAREALQSIENQYEDAVAALDEIIADKSVEIARGHQGGKQ